MIEAHVCRVTPSQMVNIPLLHHCGYPGIRSAIFLLVSKSEKKTIYGMYNPIYKHYNIKGLKNCGQYLWSVTKTRLIRQSWSSHSHVFYPSMFNPTVGEFIPSHHIPFAKLT
jgi:hypothetical protein